MDIIVRTDDVGRLIRALDKEGSGTDLKMWATRVDGRLHVRLSRKQFKSLIERHSVHDTIGHYGERA